MELTLFRPKFNTIVNAPSSKSELHRLIVCALLSEAPTDLLFDGCVSDDIAASLSCAEALGADVSVSGGQITVSPPVRFLRGSTLDCRSSGTSIRFFLCLCAVLGTGSTLVFSDDLAGRPLAPLAKALEQRGAVLDVNKNAITVKSGVLNSDFSVAGNVSSQFVSGLLFACTVTGGSVTLTTPPESKDYINMTLRALKDFGCEITQKQNVYTVPKAFPFSAENAYTAGGDWSNAAYALIGGAIGEKPVTVCGLDGDSAQGDRKILDILRKNGAKIEENDRKITVFPSSVHPFTVSGRDIPDIVPPLCVLASCADGVSEIRDIDRLRLKETDRIASTVSLLNALGGKAAYKDGRLIIRGSPLSGGRVNGCGDHRTVMTAALASTVCKNEVVISDAEAVRKSFPSFFSQIMI